MVDAAARASYDMLLDLDWEDLGYVGLPHGHDRGLGLTGEIHNLFRYNLPGRPIPIWYRQSHGQYLATLAVLRPVFRLATNFLLCPASLGWFYYLIYAPRKLTDPLIQHNGDDVFEYRRDGTDMTERHRKARAALERLAMVHTISLDDFGNNNEDEGVTSVGTKFHQQGVNIKDDWSPPNGIGFHVSINRDFVRILMELCMEGHDSVTQMFVIGTKMAVTWIHEIAHGAWMASNLKLREASRREDAYRAQALANHLQREPKELNLNEDLFEDENCAEPGYSWEKFVFGGNIELPYFNPDRPLVFFKWPNFLKGDRDLRRRRWKPSATQYFIPWPWIINVNSQKWWDSWTSSVREDHITALHIKKIVGYRIYWSSLSLDVDWIPSESSEGVWPTDEELTGGEKPFLRVSRKGAGVRNKDPSFAGANELGGP